MTVWGAFELIRISRREPALRSRRPRSPPTRAGRPAMTHGGSAAAGPPTTERSAGPRGWRSVVWTGRRGGIESFGGGVLRRLVPAPIAGLARRLWDAPWTESARELLEALRRRRAVTGSPAWAPRWRFVILSVFPALLMMALALGFLGSILGQAVGQQAQDRVIATLRPGSGYPSCLSCSSCGRRRCSTLPRTTRPLGVPTPPALRSPPRSGPSRHWDCTSGWRWRRATRSSARSAGRSSCSCGYTCSRSGS